MVANLGVMPTTAYGPQCSLNTESGVSPKSIPGCSSSALPASQRILQVPLLPYLASTTAVIYKDFY